MPKRAYPEIKMEPSGKVSKSSPAQTIIVKSRRPTSYKKNSFAAKVKKVLHQSAEHKEAVTNLNTDLNSTQTSVQVLNAIAEGTSPISRVGRAVTHSYCEVDIAITFQNISSNIDPRGDFGFWAIVLDRQPNGALAAFGDIFDTTNSVPGLAFRNTLNFQDRFKILCREEWVVGQMGIASAAALFSTGAQAYHMKKYIDMSNLEGNDATTNYLGSTANINTIDQGALLFVAASTVSTATNAAHIYGQAKWRFTDV